MLFTRKVSLKSWYHQILELKRNFKLGFLETSVATSIIPHPLSYYVTLSEWFIQDLWLSAYKLKPICIFTNILHCLWKCSSLSCVWLCDPIGCSPPGSSVHGILQTKILEWVAIPFSKGSCWSRDGTLVSHIAGGFFTIWEYCLYKNTNWQLVP